jgi:hypothetical protein
LFFGFFFIPVPGAGGQFNGWGSLSKKLFILFLISFFLSYFMRTTAAAGARGPPSILTAL